MTNAVNIKIQCTSIIIFFSMFIQGIKMQIYWSDQIGPKVTLMSANSRPSVIHIHAIHVMYVCELQIECETLMSHKLCVLTRNQMSYSDLASPYISHTLYIKKLFSQQQHIGPHRSLKVLWLALLDLSILMFKTV